MRRLVTVVALGMCSIFAFGRHSEPIQIEQVEVRGTTRPLAILAFDTTILRQYRGASVGELLSQLSPVNILDYGRGARQMASFRGTDPSHTSVTWNSLQINSPIEGSVDLSLLPLYSLDALSITPGISSLGNNSGALGGSIEIESRPQWGEKTSASVSLGYGSFNSADAMASVRAGNERLQSSTKAVFNYSKNDFRFINRDIIDPENPGQETWQSNENARYYNFGLSQDFFVRLPDAQTLSFSLLALSSDRDLPQLTTYEGPINSNLTNSVQQSLRGVVRYKKFGKRLDIEATAGATFEHNKFIKEVLQSGLYVPNINSLSSGQTGQATLDLDYRIAANHTLVWSTKLSGQWADSREEVRKTGFGEGRFELSQKAEISNKWNDHLSSSALVRLDVVGQMVTVSAMAGVEYHFANGLALSARGGYNSHHPSLSALYYTPGANPDLRPEQGPTVELAMAYKHKWLSINLTAFDSWIEDWIIWLPTATQYWTPSNLRSVNAAGIELTADASWIFNKTWGLNIRGSMSLNSTRNTGEPIKANDMSQGAQLPFVPLVSGGMFVKAHYRYKVWLTYAFNGQSEKNSTTANNQSYLSIIEPFTLHNISAGYAPWRFLSVELVCKNLLNSYYYGIERRPMAPRYFGASLTWML